MMISGKVMNLVIINSVNLTNIYFRFNLELGELGVDVQALNYPAALREFVRWAEDWEKELKKKN